MAKKESELWTKKIKKGLELTYQRLIEYKKMKNSPLVVMKDGKIVEVSADDLPPTTEIL